MAHAASREFGHNWHDPSRSADFLLKLERAHAEVEACLAGLEAAMAAAEPDPIRFSVTRLRLARANLARTQAARETCGHLIDATLPDSAAALRDLQQREIEHAHMISDHIRQWTPQRLKDDWEGYRAATRRLLDRVRELIARERSLLLPLLRQTS